MRPEGRLLPIPGRPGRELSRRFGARQYADSVATRVVLIDGERLARLMIRYGVGVQVKQTYHRARSTRTSSSLR